MKESKKITINNILKEDLLVAAKLFKLRLLSGVNRFELSKMTDIEEFLIASYENGLRPIPASDLYILTMALGFDMDYICTKSDLYHINDSRVIAAVN